MGTVDDPSVAAVELPLLLTVEEAAAVLRIGRTLAYSLARQYEESGGAVGLPVIRIGGRLRVPRWALLELARFGRIVALSELAAHTVQQLSRFDGEPRLDLDTGEEQRLTEVEPRVMRKSKRSKRPASRATAAREAGQQLVLLPSD